MERGREITVLAVIVMMVATSVGFAVANQNKGAEDMQIAGGTRGDVPFPHRAHQERLDDCNVCHSTFPQKSGSIAALKANGKLKKKYVMNKLCTKCHKETKKAGQKSGPTTCKACHIK